MLCSNSGLTCVTNRQIALTTMRRIGSQAHPLTVVNFFAWVVVLVATALVVIEQFAWPTSLMAWGYLAIVGVFGGVMVGFLGFSPKKNPRKRKKKKKKSVSAASRTNAHTSPRRSF